MALAREKDVFAEISLSRLGKRASDSQQPLCEGRGRAGCSEGRVGVRGVAGN